MRLRILQLLSASILSIYVLTLCAAPSAFTPKKGVVLDWETKEPIAGAIVVAQWQGYRSAIVQTYSVCYHVESVTTDEQGHFRLPVYLDHAFSVQEKHVMIFIYKTGFKRSVDEDNYVRNFYKEGLYYQEKDNRTGEDRIDYLLKFSPVCGARDGSKVNYSDLYGALYDEADRLATTREEKLKTLYLLRNFEKVTIGSDEAWERFHRRKRELK